MVAGGLLPFSKFYFEKCGLNKTESFITTIPSNSGSNESKAYIYLETAHSDYGDATSFDFGIIRTGYSDGFVTKYSIKSYNNAEGVQYKNNGGFIEIINQSVSRKVIMLFG